MGNSTHMADSLTVSSSKGFPKGLSDSEDASGSLSPLSKPVFHPVGPWGFAFRPYRIEQEARQGFTGAKEIPTGTTSWETLSVAGGSVLRLFGSLKSDPLNPCTMLERVTVQPTHAPCSALHRRLVWDTQLCPYSTEALMLLTVLSWPLVFSAQLQSSMVRETGAICPVLSHDHNTE